MYGVYSIYDKLSCEFSDLRLFKNDELAKRYFRSICKDCKFADELQLFKMCDYNVEKGLLSCNFENLSEGEFSFFVGFKPEFIEAGVVNE